MKNPSLKRHSQSHPQACLDVSLITPCRQTTTEAAVTTPCLSHLEPDLPLKTESAACEELWTRLSQLHTPGFFITAEIKQSGPEFPTDLMSFIEQRLTAFSQGLTTRKFVFHSQKWRIYLTFFPTDRVVEEKYALKNKVMKTKKTLNSLSFPK